jgi:hypothetical protein
MKTNIFLHKNFIYASNCIFSFLMASCGSYQNTSYYDNDGIYGTTSNQTSERTVQNTPDNQYKPILISSKHQSN